AVRGVWAETPSDAPARAEGPGRQALHGPGHHTGGGGRERSLGDVRLERVVTRRRRQGAPAGSRSARAGGSGL
ncbi:MAG: hypothetical protein AVDCRST_MAG90-770, partial [uncultured Microvirga sp.]